MNLDETKQEIQAMILDMREEQNEKIQELDTRSTLIETKNLIQESKLETQKLLENKMQDMLNAMKSETTENTMKMLEENFKTMITNIMENQNATQSLLEEKMANLNYKDEISSLMNKVERLENDISSNQTNTDIANLMNKMIDVEQAVNSKDSEEKLSKAVEKMRLENEKKLEKLDSSDQIKEIMKELKKINTRYDKLALEVNKNLTAMKKASQVTTKQPAKQTTKTKAANKNNVIELETAKKKMKQEELIIEYGKEIEYEQLLDLAIGVYEFNTNQNQRRAK